jgi:hypothetical protein
MSGRRPDHGRAAADEAGLGAEFRSGIVKHQRCEFRHQAINRLSRRRGDLAFGDTPPCGPERKLTPARTSTREGFQLAVQLTVGTALVLLFQLPRNPKLVLAPAPSAPFQAALDAVTTEPLDVTVALQLWVTV